MIRANIELGGAGIVNDLLTLRLSLFSQTLVALQNVMSLMLNQYTHYEAPKTHPYP